MILTNINVVVLRQVKRENSSLSVNCELSLPYLFQMFTPSSLEGQFSAKPSSCADKNCIRTTLKNLETHSTNFPKYVIKGIKRTQRKAIHNHAGLMKVQNCAPSS